MARVNEVTQKFMKEQVPGINLGSTGFKLLGVREGATRREIEVVTKAKSFPLHPDKVQTWLIDQEPSLDPEASPKHPPCLIVLEATAVQSNVPGWFILIAIACDAICFCSISSVPHSEHHQVMQQVMVLLGQWWNTYQDHVTVQEPSLVALWPPEWCSHVRLLLSTCAPCVSPWLAGSACL
jgi:hypothetical protein